MSKPKKTLPKTDPEVLKKPLEPIDNRSKPSATAHSHDKALIKYETLDGEQIEDIGQAIAANGEQVLQVGKRKFVRLVS